MLQISTSVLRASQTVAMMRGVLTSSVALRALAIAALRETVGPAQVLFCSLYIAFMGVYPSGTRGLVAFKVLPGVL